MPSPFPGMDPYLEDPARWAGVHTNLIVAIQAALNRVLPDGYVAEVELFVWSGEQPEEPAALRRKPDVFLPRTRRGGSGGPATGLAVAPPSALTHLPERHVRRNKRVEIRTADGNEVVTVIELLRPSNKRAAGEDRAMYLAKRGEYFASRANLVEIDLLRDGDRLPMGEPRPPVSDYYVFVAPADQRADAQVWAWDLPAPVPAVPIPLRPPDGPVPLELKACLDWVYENGRYADKLNYRRPPVPPLNDRDTVWAAGLLGKPGRRRG